MIQSIQDPKLVEPRAQFEEVPLLQTRFHKVTVEQLIDYIVDAGQRPEKTVVGNVNIRSANFSCDLPWYRSFLNRSDLVFCDGFGTLLGSKLLGADVQSCHRMTAPDYIEDLAQACDRNNLSVFLLAGEPGITDRAIAQLKAIAPNLRIQGHHGYFEKSGPENDAVIDAINAFKPDVLYVGFGMPLQEWWIDENLDRIDAKVFLPLGACLDFYTGAVNRGPRWATDMGLEWLTRLFTEPGRLWQRYLVGNPLFFYRVFKTMLGQRVQTLQVPSQAPTQPSAQASAHPPAARRSSNNIDLRASTFTTLRKGLPLVSLRVLTLLSLDISLLSAAQEANRWLTHQPYWFWSQQEQTLVMLLSVALQVCFMAACGLYGPGEHRRDSGTVAKALALAALPLGLAASLQPNGFVLGTAVAAVWLLSVIFVMAGRAALDRAIASVRRSGTGRYPSVLICPSDQVEAARQLLGQQNRYALKGWIDVNAIDNSGWDLTLKTISQQGVSDVFLYGTQTVENSMFLYWKLRNAGITLQVLPANLSALPRESKLGKDLSSHRLTPPLLTGSEFLVKRVFDTCGALLLLLLLSPLLLLIATLIKLDSPGPIFFKQTRMGLKDDLFQAWKFRTMVINAEALQAQLETMNETQDGILFKVKKDPRITRVGVFLRQYSLDELPQLINVLLGEMSLVGPRPLPLRDTEKFSPHHFVRHEVLPGITGLWQVSGRSDILDFEDVVALDLRYIENWSLLLDVRILLRTVDTVLRKTGAY